MMARKKSGAFERFNNARAEKFELENKKTRRELIPREEIEAEWLRLISHLKYGFSAMPSRMARELSGVSDPGEIYEIVERDINNIFESLSNLGLELEAEAEQELREAEESPEEGGLEEAQAEAAEEGAAEYVESEDELTLPEPPKRKKRKSKKEAEKS